MVNKKKRRIVESDDDEEEDEDGGEKGGRAPEEDQPPMAEEEEAPPPPKEEEAGPKLEKNACRPVPKLLLHAAVWVKDESAATKMETGAEGCWPRRSPGLPKPKPAPKVPSRRAKRRILRQFTNHDLCRLAGHHL